MNVPDLTLAGRNRRIEELEAEVERLREAAQWVYNDGSTRLCVPEDLLNVLKRALEGE